MAGIGCGFNRWMQHTLGTAQAEGVLQMKQPFIAKELTLSVPAQACHFVTTGVMGN
jgi:hypothetical protein